MDKTMGWCDTHVTSQSDASKDFHVKDSDCAGFASAESLIPDIKGVAAKAAKVNRISWFVALGLAVAFAVLLFATGSAGGGLQEVAILAAACVVLFLAVKSLTRVVAEAVMVTDADKRLIPKVQFIAENEILTEDDFQGSEVR